MKIVEGYMPYLEYKTYYRIIGEQMICYICRAFFISAI